MEHPCSLQPIHRSRRGTTADPRRRILSGRDGFTLVEVLVAFTILALLTVAVQRGIVVSLDGMAKAEERIDAESVARTLLTGPVTAAQAAAGRSSGRMNGHDWTMRFSAVDLPFAAASGREGGEPQWVPLRLRVEVSGKDRRAGLVVETIRLVPLAPVITQ